MTEHDLAKLLSFHMTRLRKIQRIFLSRTISIYDLLAQCQQEEPGQPQRITSGLRGYGDHHHQEAMALDWARAAQGCQLHHQSCNPLDPIGKAETRSTEDNLAKNCGSGTEEHEPQLGHHPEAGQCRTGVAELRCCPIYASWRDG